MPIRKPWDHPITLKDDFKPDSVRVLVTCLISNVVTDPCSRPKPTRTSGHVIWSSGIATMPILHSPDCPTALCKLQFPEPESDSNSRPMDRVALGCHKGS